MVPVLFIGSLLFNIIKYIYFIGRSADNANEINILYTILKKYCQTAEIAQKIMKDKPFVKIHDDGFHYDRIIGGEVHTKIMVGNV